MDTCKIAYDFLLSNDFQGIYKFIDIGDLHVFFGGNPDETYYGIRTVSVDKKTGYVDLYNSYENKEILKNGKEIDIPKEYMYKAS